MANSKDLFFDLDKFYNATYRSYNLLNKRYKFDSNIHVLSWESYLGINRFENYGEYFHWVFEKNQYSFMLDGNYLVQIFGESDHHGNLLRASYSFLPEPDDVYQYLRLDYDPSAYRANYHNSYHLHVGYNNEFRITMGNFPFPSQFVKFLAFLIGLDENVKFKAKSFFNKNIWELREEYNHHFSFMNG